MILKEAYIENFGKLHNKEIVFRPGINVICGGNEVGKTTLAEFLSAMLFGLEPKRGRSQKNDTYRRYEPWNAASYYCGSLRFEIEDRPFVLKRNFYHKEKTAELKNEADGEQLSVEFGDLSMLLGELGRSAYENTWCIGQTGAVTGDELADILREYLSNLENTGEADISLLLAQKNLEQRGKEIRREKKALLEEKESRVEKLRVEEQLLTGDMEKLEEQTGHEAIRHDLKIQALMREKIRMADLDGGPMRSGGCVSSVFIWKVCRGSMVRGGNAVSVLSVFCGFHRPQTASETGGSAGTTESGDAASSGAGADIRGADDG